MDRMHTGGFSGRGLSRRAGQRSLDWSKQKQNSGDEPSGKTQ